MRISLRPRAVSPHASRTTADFLLSAFPPAEFLESPTQRRHSYFRHPRPPRRDARPPTPHPPPPSPTPFLPTFNEVLSLCSVVVVFSHSLVALSAPTVTSLSFDSACPPSKPNPFYPFHHLFSFRTDPQFSPRGLDVFKEERGVSAGRNPDPPSGHLEDGLLSSLRQFPPCNFSLPRHLFFSGLSVLEAHFPFVFACSHGQAPCGYPRPTNLLNRNRWYTLVLPHRSRPCDIFGGGLLIRPRPFFARPSATSFRYCAHRFFLPSSSVSG